MKKSEKYISINNKSCYLNSRPIPKRTIDQDVLISLNFIILYLRLDQYSAGQVKNEENVFA